MGIRVDTVRLLFVLCCCVPVRSQMHSSSSVETSGTGALVGESLPFQLSPVCWRDALEMVRALHRDDHPHHHQHSNNNNNNNNNKDGIGTELCNAMSHHHQKTLAVEMARCHLHDMNRPLFVDAAAAATRDHNNACQAPLVHPETLRHCLGRMSDVGLNSYTHFLTHVQQMCLRLTQEEWFLHQRDVSHRLTQASQEASHRFGLLVSQQDELWKQTEQREAQWMERHNHALHNMQQQQERSIQQQLLLYKNQQERIQQYQDEALERIHSREGELQKQQAAWMAQQTDWFDASSSQLHTQQDQIKELSRVVLTTTDKIKPLLGIDSIVSLVNTGASVASSILFYLVVMNLIWLVTLPSWFRSSRLYMVGVALLAFAGEVRLGWLDYHAVALLADYSTIDPTTMIRCGMLAWLVLLCLGSLVKTAWFGRHRSREERAREAWEKQQTELLQRLEQTALLQQQRAMEREERLVQALLDARAVAPLARQQVLHPSLTSLPPQSSLEVLPHPAEQQQQYPMVYRSNEKDTFVARDYSVMVTPETSRRPKTSETLGNHHPNRRGLKRERDDNDDQVVLVSKKSRGHE